MDRKPNFLEKLGAFVSGKGFYFVVLLCVAAIALSGLYLIRGVRTGLTGEDEPASASTPLPESPSPGVLPSEPAETGAPAIPTLPVRPGPTPSQSPAPTPSPAPQPSQSPKPLVFTWPVSGPVIAGYTVEALAYDVTMGDWRTHAGVDIAAAVGMDRSAVSKRLRGQIVPRIELVMQAVDKCM